MLQAMEHSSGVHEGCVVTLGWAPAGIISLVGGGGFSRCQFIAGSGRVISGNVDPGAGCHKDGRVTLTQEKGREGEVWRQFRCSQTSPATAVQCREMSLAPKRNAERFLVHYLVHLTGVSARAETCICTWHPFPHNPTVKACKTRGRRKHAREATCLRPHSWWEWDPAPLSLWLTGVCSVLAVHRLLHGARRPTFPSISPSPRRYRSKDRVSL